jgi:DNA helicase TIP49 (TBP-interacting protein)
MNAPRFLFRFAAAALVAAAWIVARPASADAPVTVVATVTYDAGSKTATMTTSQNLPDKLIKLSIKNGDTVNWVSPSGLVYVEGWTPENPFVDAPKHDKKVLKSGPAKKRGTFKYTVLLHLDGEPDPKKMIKVDPSIEVME